MRYQGGKHYIAKHISAEIMKRRTTQTVFIEPFMGGGSVSAVMAKDFRTAHLSDINPDVIAMWRKVLLEDWLPPTEVSEEEYYYIRENGPDYLRGFTASACSFAATGRGYARKTPTKQTDFAGNGVKLVVAKRDEMRKCHDLTVTNVSYESIHNLVGPNTVVYCDPPYAGTEGYKRVGLPSPGRFDSEKFWGVMGEWVNLGALVFVSEYNAPEDFISVWSKDRKVYAAKNNSGYRAVEHLFMHESQEGKTNDA